jgi:hypothetical protein
MIDVVVCEASAPAKTRQAKHTPSYRPPPSPPPRCSHRDSRLRPCGSEPWAAREVERLLDSDTRASLIEALQVLIPVRCSGPCQSN